MLQSYPYEKDTESLIPSNSIRIVFFGLLYSDILMTIDFVQNLPSALLCQGLVLLIN